jgi:hypothetical protein
MATTTTKADDAIHIPDTLASEAGDGGAKAKIRPPKPSKNSDAAARRCCASCLF